MALDWTDWCLEFSGTSNYVSLDANDRLKAREDSPYQFGLNPLAFSSVGRADEEVVGFWVPRGRSMVVVAIAGGLRDGEQSASTGAGTLRAWVVQFMDDQTSKDVHEDRIRRLLEEGEEGLIRLFPLEGGISVQVRDRRVREVRVSLAGQIASPPDFDERQAGRLDPRRSSCDSRYPARIEGRFKGVRCPKKPWWFI